MKPVNYTFDAKAESAEFLLYDVIGKDFFGDGVTAKAMKEALDATKGAKTLNLRINSPGGDVFEAHAIYNLLNTSGRNITVDIDGLAASAASYIAMAGDVIRIAAGGDVMIHNVHAMVWGDSKALRKEADLADKLTDTIAHLYAERTGREKSEFLAWMDAETWFTGSEALDAGLVDEVTPAKRMAAVFDPKRFAYKNVPERILQGCVEEPADLTKSDVHAEYRAEMAAIRERMKRNV